MYEERFSSFSDSCHVMSSKSCLSKPCLVGSKGTSSFVRGGGEIIFRWINMGLTPSCRRKFQKESAVFNILSKKTAFFYC